MIAPCEVVARLLVAAIALLAITFGVLQFYPRILAMWKPRSSDVPISKLVQYQGAKRLLWKIKLAIGILALSIFVGIIYLLAALSTLSILIPIWVDVLMNVLGLILLASAIGLLAFGAITFKEEELSDTLEK